MDTGEAIEVADAVVLEGDSTSPVERDYEAEARNHGWTPKDDFKGDPSKWVDAETFAKRADEVMPFLKKQNGAMKREIDDLKRQMRKAADYFSKAEERAYKQAAADIERKHSEAVEVGDTVAAKQAVADLRTLEKDFEQAKDGAGDVDDKPNPDDLRKELNDWIEANDWYVLDDKKRAYADLQAERMGLAEHWTGGRKAWFDELAKRVDGKFSEKPVAHVNAGGNRPGPKGGKSFADLPPEARKLCDKWVSSGLIKSRDDYVKNYDWS